MRVTTCENIDVEVTVDVTIDDCLDELGRQLEEMDHEDRRRRLQTSRLDIATRILQQTPPDVFANLTCEQWDVLRSRIPQAMRSICPMEEAQPS